MNHDTCEVAILTPQPWFGAKLLKIEKCLKIKKQSQTPLVFIRQPLYAPENGKKAAIGDLVSLECLAVARFGLKYEWLKRGLSEDLVETNADSADGRARSKCVDATGLIPVCRGPAMTDPVEESSEVAAVSFWVYQCCVTCPMTG